jgi:hypothetical protein
MQFFPVIFGGSSNHPLTLDYAARVAAVGGSLPVSAYRAYNYLFSSLVNTMGLNPANLYAHTFDGGINGIVVPAFNRAGAVGNATNVGYVSGDYSDADGLVQNGSNGKYLDSQLGLSDVPITCFGFGAYYSGPVLQPRFLFGGAFTGNTNLVALERNNTSGVGNAVGRRNNSTANAVPGAAAATAVARLAFSSASSTDLRLFRNGAQDGATQTGSRSVGANSVNIVFGAYRIESGAVAFGVNATQVFSLIGIGSMTPTQMAQLDAIVREFLIRRGRPPCD